MSNRMGWSPPAAHRYIVAPPGGLITCATLEEAVTRAKEWSNWKQQRPMTIYQVTVIRTVVSEPPALPT